MAAEEILIEIDVTLDRLIQNAEALIGADMNEVSLAELEAFQKTQESLIHHLIHTDQLLEQKRKSLSHLDKRSAGYRISEKRAKFERLKSSCHRTLSQTTDKKLPILSKRRNKRFLMTH